MIEAIEATAETRSWRSRLTGLHTVAARFRQTLADILRGYSQADVEREQRILNGAITPEDRKRFIDWEIGKWYLIAAVPPSRISLIDPVFNPFVDTHGLTEAADNLRHLPSEKVDSRMRIRARENLASWHHLPPETF